VVVGLRVGVGPDHERVFTAQAIVDGETLGEGTGTSKKLAEHEAAEAADDATRTVMLETFADATRYEELFWERSHSLETWTL